MEPAHDWRARKWWRGRIPCVSVAMSEPGVRSVEVLIRGAVQGVGFRPHLFRLATRFGIVGEVANTAEGVSLAVEGPPGAMDAFLRVVTEEAPPLSIIERLEMRDMPPRGFTSFAIRECASEGEAAAHILPDIATCPDCLAEIRNPADRRFRYPFTNCTNCGPRFTIIFRLPYDRPNTTMRYFPLCETCRAEYGDPMNRRFHAQPTACPACGPHLELWEQDGGVLAKHDAALLAAVDALRNGKVVAVKGLGGFHLMADARNAEAIKHLRLFKRREEKPFAVLFAGLEAVRRDCALSELDVRLLESPERPIVLVPRAQEDTLAANVAPGAPRFGVMLPSTPLHYLLMDEFGGPLVATSGNLSEEPICIDEHDALQRFRGIAHFWLVHNRAIVRHVDDSIVQTACGREMVLRRARGFAPLPVRVEPDGPTLLAVGAHLKNTVALAKNGNVFLSQHIGNLETDVAFKAFVAAGKTLETLYAAAPVHVAHDLHPDYACTRYAGGLGVPATGVQHHHAHIVSCMAEQGLEGSVLGVSWDGAGYGPDGTIWGGEFLRATRESFERVGCLRPFRLPGGDRAAREPRRCALGALYELHGETLGHQEELPLLAAFQARELYPLLVMLNSGFNSPWTSSAGRLFDAVAALLGIRQRMSFEGQAAMEVEYAARRHRGPTPALTLELGAQDRLFVLDWGPLLLRMIEAVRDGAAAEALAHAFHEALAAAILRMAQKAALPDVVLSGGCFQNTLLLELAVARLREGGFTAHWHRRIPPNDGGIALGQAACALRKLRSAGPAR